MMKFEGNFSVSVPMSVVEDYFKDISEVIKCLPHMEEYKIEGNKISAIFKIDIREAGIPHMSTITISYNASYQYLNNIIKVEGDGKAAGIKVKISILLEVTQKDNEITDIKWTADIDLGILTKILGEKLLKSIADKNIEIITNCIKFNLIKRSQIK